MGLTLPQRDERKICDKFNLAHQKTLNNIFFKFERLKCLQN